MRTIENNNELHKIKQIKDTVVRKKLKYKTSKRICNFQKFKTIILGDNIISGKIKISGADEKRSNLVNNILKLMIKLDKNQNKMRRKKVMLM